MVSQPNSYCQTGKSQSFLLATCACCSPSTTDVLTRLLSTSPEVTSMAENYPVWKMNVFRHTESYSSPVKGLKNIKGHANKWVDLYIGGERRQNSKTFSQQRWTATAAHNIPWSKHLRNSYIQLLSCDMYLDSLKATYPSYLGSHGNSPFSWRSLSSVLMHITRFLQILATLQSMFSKWFPISLTLPVGWEKNLTLATTESHVMVISTSLSFNITKAG